MPPHNLFDQFGRPLTLGPQIGKGGEGTVFSIASDPASVAKVYHKPPSPYHEAKLRAMISLSRKELCDIAAWPTATLHETRGGPICGLMMRKIKDYKEIHFLYSPAHRKVAFPLANWPFLVHTAMNCAHAFDEVHRFGVVIGDVNQSNVFVSDQGRVCLIDCDSYQVQLNGQFYGCEVGIDLFTPPELQGRPFRGVVRTPNHDRFGLAVLIFYLLFMNRHPFAGRYLGQGEMPIEKAIKEYGFAYGRSARSYQMQTPPHALPLSAVSMQLVELFERAFGPQSSQPNARPAPSEWVTSLKAFLGSLRRCPSDSGHDYSPHLASCPWCTLMRQGAPNFFITVAYARAATSPTAIVFDLSAIWARIDQVPRPTNSYVRPIVLASTNPKPWPLSSNRPIPPRPNTPPILTAPAPTLAKPIIRPKRKRVVISPERIQRIVGTTAAICASGFLPVLVCAVLLAAASYRIAAVVGFLGLLASLASLILGGWWGCLEWVRRQQQNAINMEYDAEVSALWAEARQAQRVWEMQFAKQKAEARLHHEQQILDWEKAVAGIQAEAQRTRATLQAEAQRRRDALSRWRQQTDAAERNWEVAAQRLTGEYDAKKSALQSLHDRHKQLAGEYAGERQRLQARVREMQMEQYLDQKIISDHKIPGIGPGRTAMLDSNGIQTALDVVEDQVVAVPGFGPELTNRLIQWRRSMESQFEFNAVAGVPAHMEQAVDSKFVQARQQIEAAILSGERELKSISTRAESELRLLYEHIKSALLQSAQANAEVAVIPPEF